MSASSFNPGRDIAGSSKEASSSRDQGRLPAGEYRGKGNVKRNLEPFGLISPDV